MSAPRVTLLCVGKSKFSWVAEGLAHYAKLLSPFMHFRVVETKTVAGSLSPAEQIVREAELLSGKISEREHLACLDRTGRQMNSEQFANWLQSVTESGRDLTLVIGGPYGLNTGLRERAEAVIALSQLTFPHDLVRLVCAEQLYRAVTIQRGHPYHK